jgi:hypothetical protein
MLRYIRLKCIKLKCTSASIRPFRTIGISCCIKTCQSWLFHSSFLSMYVFSVSRNNLLALSKRLTYSWKFGALIVEGHRGQNV